MVCFPVRGHEYLCSGRHGKLREEIAGGRRRSRRRGRSWLQRPSLPSSGYYGHTGEGQCVQSQILGPRLVCLEPPCLTGGISAQPLRFCCSHDFPGSGMCRQTRAPSPQSPAGVALGWGRPEDQKWPAPRILGGAVPSVLSTQCLGWRSCLVFARILLCCCSLAISFLFILGAGILSASPDLLFECPQAGTTSVP